MSKCVHAFMRAMLTKPKPTHCEYCRKLLWVFGGKFRHCTQCGIFLHEECFREIISNTQEQLRGSTDPSTATMMMKGEAAVHSGSGGELSEFDMVEEAKPAVALGPDVEPHRHIFTWKTFFLPTNCDVCHELLVGLYRQGLECTECTFNVHSHCIDRLGAPCTVLTAEELSRANAARGADTSAAMGEAMQLLQMFKERNSKWPIRLMNPVIISDATKRHGMLYQQSCSALHDSTISAEQLYHARVALRYATAVYGKTYEEGFFSSLGAAAGMRVFGASAMNAKSEINNQSVCDIAGLPRNALLHSHWSDSVSAPSYVVLLDHVERTVAWVFRGSLTDEDWLADARSAPTSFCGADAHGGIALMAQSALGDREAVTLLQDLLRAHPSYRLCVTGHSLGAGLASLVTAHCVAEGTFAPCIPCGFAFAPPPTMSIPGANRFNIELLSFVAGKDVVCRLQLNAVDRLGVELGAATVGSQQVINDLTEELHIVGRVLLMTSPSNQHSEMRLVDVPRTHAVLHQIILGPKMLECHFMDHYAEGLSICARKKQQEAAATA